MERGDAIKKIYEWAECLEVDTEREHFKDVVEELTLPVMKDRLDFDLEEEVFRYKLLSPIVKQDGSGSIEILTIKETDMNENKEIQRFKDNQSIDQATALLSKACGIPVGFVSRIKQRDIGKINAVVLGFFAQTGSSRG
ncbi:MAG: hypothetical protein CVV44_03845 [Spirochaetae bacterium HGW-Spirochaetae-1]|jgi:hypothetical protein|nr:MAG: hypothetical protein CVV44_03845 [Spirochaetae bacterium HGW-Spirochaetae-1]